MTSFAAALPLPSDRIEARVLSAKVGVLHAVPAGATKVIFGSTGNFYAKFGGSAKLPTTSVLDGTASEVNPVARRIPPGVTTIGLISASAVTVTMSFYTEPASPMNEDDSTAWVVAV